MLAPAEVRVQVPGDHAAGFLWRPCFCDDLAKRSQCRGEILPLGQALVCQLIEQLDGPVTHRAEHGGTSPFVIGSGRQHLRERLGFFGILHLAKLQRGLKAEARIGGVGEPLELGQRRRIARFSLTELQGLERGRLGLGGLFFGGGAQLHDSPDPPLVGAGPEGKFAPDRLGQIAGMIDVLAHHVANVERAIRANGGVDGTKPLIRRREEIPARRGMLCEERRPAWPEALALHEVLRRLANERAPAANADAAGARVRAGVLLVDEARDVSGSGGVGADRVNPRGDRHDVLDCLGERKMRVALQDVRREDDVHQRVAVARHETMAKRVEALAKLPGAGEWLVHKCLGVKPPVLPLGRHGGAAWV